MKKFINYVLAFYGPGGVYPYHFTREEVINAIFVHLDKTSTEFIGDSIDRERVRDYVLESREQLVSA
jgi:hypothetical protein